MVKEKVENVSVVCHDDYYMVSNNGVYYKVGVLEGGILTRLVNNETRANILEQEGITEEEYIYLLEVFEKNGIIGEKIKDKFNVLFIKIPLFNIDEWLDKCCVWFGKHKKIKQILGSILWSLILIGIVNVIINFEDIFRVQSVQLIWYDYLLAYVIYTITIFLHEVGHGYVCKSYGGKVGKIGIAFIVFTPAMYCDVSGVRMFKEKHKQILTSAAGFFVNAVFVGVFSAMAYWDDNPLWKTMIILNVMSIFINSIPFIRLDGYWILSFVIGIQNLYNKSISKIKNIKKKSEFKNWKDYFCLIYGVLNTIIIIYCCVHFSVSTLSLVYDLIY